MAALVLFDDDRRFVWSAHGFESGQHADEILGAAIPPTHKLTFIPDTANDHRFGCDLGEVRSIGMYCGAPLDLGNNLPHAALCVLSRKALWLNVKQQQSLVSLASLASIGIRKIFFDAGSSASPWAEASIFNLVPSIMIRVDASGVIRQFNSAAERIFMVSAETVTGLHLIDCERRFGWPSISNFINVAIKSFAPLRLSDQTLKLPGLDSRILGLEILPIGEFGRDGFLISGADVTSRRQKEAEAKRSEERRRELLENMNDIVFRLSLKGRIEFVNEAWRKSLGFDVAETIGKRIQNYVHPDDQPRWESAWSDVKANNFRDESHEFRFLGKDDSVRILEILWKLTPATMKGESDCVEGSLRDITERKRQEEAESAWRKFDGFIAKVSKELIGSGLQDYEETVQKTLKSIVDYLGYCRGACYKRTDSGLFRLGWEYLQEDCSATPDIADDFQLERFPTIAQKLRAFETHFVADALEIDGANWQERERMVSLGLRSKLAIPIYNEGQLHAYMTFGSREPRPAPASEVMSLLRLVASLISGLLDRVKTEETIRTLNARTVESYRTQLEQVLANAPILLFMADQTGEVTLWDGKGLDSVGQRSGQLIGKNLFQVYASNADLCRAFHRALDGESFSHEMRLGGSTFDTHFSPIVEEGIVTGLIGVCLNISDRVQATETLRLREQAISAGRNSIVITDHRLPDNPIVYVNEQFTKITGFTLEDVQGKNCRFMQGADRDQEALYEIRQALKEGRECCVILRNYRKDGTMFWNELTMYPVRDENGEITNFVGVQEDITERRYVQAQRAHSQKMESVGELAAGIAHEINTPMQYVGDNVTFLQKATDAIISFQTDLLAETEIASPDLAAVANKLITTGDLDFYIEEIPRALAQASDGIRRVSDIVVALKEFSHPGNSDMVDIDLTLSIMSTVTIARNEWKYVAKLSTDFEEGLPLVRCFPSDFNQVILNLVVNAAQAIRQRAAAGDYEMGEINVSARTQGSWLEVRVQDNGGGIPEAVQSKIFEPFFTTKERGVGSGQGLSIAKTIIEERHNGSLTFETTSGVGTTFLIRIPFHPTSVQFSSTSAA